MKKILITGSKGFLGHHLTKTLEKDYDLLTPPSGELNIQDIIQLHN